MDKQEFRQKTQEVLDQLDAKIDEMKQGISNIAEEAKRSTVSKLKNWKE